MSGALRWEECSGRAAEIGISPPCDFGSRKLLTLTAYDLVYFSLVCQANLLSSVFILIS